MDIHGIDIAMLERDLSLLSTPKMSIASFIRRRSFGGMSSKSSRSSNRSSRNVHSFNVILPSDDEEEDIDEIADEDSFVESRNSCRKKRKNSISSSQSLSSPSNSNSLYSLHLEPCNESEEALKMNQSEVNFQERTRNANKEGSEINHISNGRNSEISKTEAVIKNGRKAEKEEEDTLNTVSLSRETSSTPRSSIYVTDRLVSNFLEGSQTKTPTTPSNSDARPFPVSKSNSELGDRKEANFGEKKSPIFANSSEVLGSGKKRKSATLSGRLSGRFKLGSGRLSLGKSKSKLAGKSGSDSSFPDRTEVSSPKSGNGRRKRSRSGCFRRPHHNRSRSRSPAYSPSPVKQLDSRSGLTSTSDLTSERGIKSATLTSSTSRTSNMSSASNPVYGSGRKSRNPIKNFIHKMTPKPARKKVQGVGDGRGFVTPPSSGPTLYQSFKAQQQNGGGSSVVQTSGTVEQNGRTQIELGLNSGHSTNVTSDGLEAPSTNEGEIGLPEKDGGESQNCREDCGGRLCGETLITCPGGENSNVPAQNGDVIAEGDLEAKEAELEVEDFEERRVTTRRRRRGRSCTNERTHFIEPDTEEMSLVADMMMDHSDMDSWKRFARELQKGALKLTRSISWGNLKNRERETVQSRDRSPVFEELISPRRSLAAILSHISEQERRILELEALIAAAHRKAGKDGSETGLEGIETGLKVVERKTNRSGAFITTVVPLFLLGGLSTVYFLQKK